MSRVLVSALAVICAASSPSWAQVEEMPAETPAETPAEDAGTVTSTEAPSTIEPTSTLAPAATDVDTGEDDERIEKGTFGGGIILGEPTGLCAKLYLNDDQALQAAAGFAFVSSGLHLHVDYIFHPAILQTRDSFVLLAYVGPGARLIQYTNGDQDDYFALGARGVGGLLFDFTQQPLDAFVEVAGVLEFGFADDEGWGPALNVGAGARYYF